MANLTLIFNDSSIHDQFRSAEEFSSAVEKLLTLRATAKTFRLEISCCYNLTTRPILNGQSLIKAANYLGHDVKILLLQWLDKGGPYWQLSPSHSQDDTYLFGDRNVGGTGLAEATSLSMQGEACSCVSLSPSDWELSPVKLSIGAFGEPHEVENFWESERLGQHLSSSVPLPGSWKELQNSLAHGWLVIDVDAFNPLQNLPFNEVQCRTLTRQLKVLDDLSNALKNRDEEMRRTIVEQFFKGSRAWFSDSSDTEKSQFGPKMTFLDKKSGCDRLCSWHGKISHGTLRLHFTDPTIVGQPITVFYIGPKITKR